MNAVGQRISRADGRLLVSLLSLLSRDSGPATAGILLPELFERFSINQTFLLHASLINVNLGSGQRCAMQCEQIWRRLNSFYTRGPGAYNSQSQP